MYLITDVAQRCDSTLHGYIFAHKSNLNCKITVEPLMSHGLFYRCPCYVDCSNILAFYGGTESSQIPSKYLNLCSSTMRMQSIPVSLLFSCLCDLNYLWPNTVYHWKSQVWKHANAGFHPYPDPWNKEIICHMEYGKYGTAIFNFAGVWL